MNILKFNSQFPDENACIAHFKAQRDAVGVVCPKCGSEEHYCLQGKLRYECKHCHYRQSLRSGTVMEHSKLPFLYWYVAMHLLASTKKSFSAAELQRQLGHKRVNHIKMVVIDDLMADTITNVVKEQVETDTELTTDDSTSYTKLGEYVKSHQAQVLKPKNLPKILPWLHIAIGNVKRLLLDIRHQLSKEYLQYYLNEFCYKFNRRYFGDKIFDRLIVAAVSYNTGFKSRIYNRSLCG